MDNLIFQFVIFAILFSVGFGFGRYYEQKHLKELAEQEARLAYIVLDTHRFATSEFAGQLISSNVVISHDYFKYAFLLPLKKIQFIIKTMLNNILKSKKNCTHTK